MKILGYDIMEGREKNFNYWATFTLNLPSFIGFVAVNEVKKLFYNTPYGIAITHKTWENYKQSPLFAFRYEQLGINYAVESLSMKEFGFFRRKVWNDDAFLKELFWHPFATMDELIDSDNFWKQKWAAKLENE